jgi:hypothetical protein
MAFTVFLFLVILPAVAVGYWAGYESGRRQALFFAFELRYRPPSRYPLAYSRRKRMNPKPNRVGPVNHEQTETLPVEAPSPSVPCPVEADTVNLAEMEPTKPPTPPVTSDASDTGRLNGRRSQAVPREVSREFRIYTARLTNPTHNPLLYFRRLKALATGGGQGPVRRRKR